MPLTSMNVGEAIMLTSISAPNVLRWPIVIAATAEKCERQTAHIASPRAASRTRSRGAGGRSRGGAGVLTTAAAGISS